MKKKITFKMSKATKRSFQENILVRAAEGTTLDDVFAHMVANFGPALGVRIRPEKPAQR